MKITVDPASIVHPYIQVADQLRHGIKTGEIGPQLPSIMTLTEQTGLAVGTIRRAIGILINEGLVATAPGRGTFVAVKREPRQPGD